jgi:hypothetical protein
MGGLFKRKSNTIKAETEQPKDGKKTSKRRYVKKTLKRRRK